MSNRTCGADQFAATLEDILGEVVTDVKTVSRGAVKKSAQKGRRAVRRNAKKQDLKVTGEYIAGWTFKVTESDGVCSAEIGNKRKPGLAHLLEKGHAKVGGGRDVPAYPHIADAAEEAFDELYTQVMEGVDSL